MKFYFTNLDNVFMLKDERCIYKGEDGIKILNSSNQEFDLLKKIMLGRDISENDYKKNNSFIKKLIKKEYLTEIDNCIKEEDKIFKTYQYLLMTHKIRNYRQLQDLQNKKVLIIGLGGVALEIINQLVALDLKNYVIVDYDIVNKNNLNRQFIFNNNDIGKFKVDIVEELIRSKVDNALVAKYNKKIQSTIDVTNILSENPNIDIVLCCADTPPLKIEQYIVSAILDKKVAYLSAGVGINKGIVGPLLTNKKNKIDFLNNLNKSEDVLDCVTNCPASFGITNSLISIIMANECINYLLGLETPTLNHSLMMDFNNYKVDIK